MKRESREVEAAIRQYVRRRLTPREKHRLAPVRLQAMHLAGQCRSPKVVIEVYNKNNPNGFLVTFRRGPVTWKMERVLNISWMRRQVALEKNAHGR